MEGLRLLAWVHESKRRGEWGIPDKCSDCMEKNSQPIRQSWACGYEPLDEKFVQIALPCGVRPEYDRDRRRTFPTTCPGFTTNLPEVIEAARARLHWSKGGPASIGIDDWSGSPLAVAIEVLEGTSNDVQSWSLDNPVKKAK